ncbi:DUF927 domain-containing protein [Deinococcus deserti]|uniref:Uncharacterized protein n=1 Tax=Deinococcus deserti (strain DSM 17065 / CIP 109153 / LMG 22923 / VCD115) TaxID=546414 RepID=C1CVM7_DEIDV|nr:DUF927 domain-containing protein [Deinococcus deserti]ACO46244.1 Hypothetical protein Deide_13090 [Deinococcus deserti VCD115]
MSALDRALELLTPGDVLEHLAAYLGKPAPHMQGSRTYGQVCDFRPGCEEKNASLSYKMGDGGSVFFRFGADEFKGGALLFLQSAGLSKPDAVARLIEWAGLTDEDRTPGEGKTPAPWKHSGRKAAGLAKARAALEKLHPLEDSKRHAALRGWQRIEVGEDSPEAQEVARRGLSGALISGLLTAYRWTGEEEGGKRRSLPRHILPGALSFEVPGPDGTPWAVKARNPGDKEALKVVNAQRYVYATAGQSTPAFVARVGGEDESQGRRVLIVEGELNAVAVAVMLEAAGRGTLALQPDARAHGWEVQGVASAVAWPHVAHIEAGARVYLYADPDAEGDAARVKWGEVLAAQGAQVYQLGPTKTGQAFPFAVEDGGTGEGLIADACDALGNMPDTVGMTTGRYAAWRGVKLLDALDLAQPWQPQTKEDGQEGSPDGQGEEGDVWLSKREGFGLRGGVLCALSMKKDEDGEVYESAEALCNFSALIVSQVSQEDGTGDAPLSFEVAGRWADGQPMRPMTAPMISAAEFSGMNWPVRVYGAEAIVRNGQGRKDKAREAIQHLSKRLGITQRTVYAHTGWLMHPDHGPVYLTAGAVIGARGAVQGVEVDLGPGLNAYALPDPQDGEEEDVRQAVRASLALLELAPDAVGVPVLGAAYRAPLGRADFAVWATGETGRNKTALMGLIQAHYGADWNRHRLPEGWLSTANALEKTAHTIKDALLMIDDFKPGGSQTDVNRAHGNLTKTLQGVADGTGRGRMGIDRKRQAGLAPRGTVMSSSETLPRGHSNRARVVVVPVERKLIHNPAMSAAYYEAEDQAGQGVYALAMAGFVQWIAAHYDAVRVGSPAHKAMTRDLAPHFEGAHGRTGPAAAELAYGHAAFLTFAVHVRAITEDAAARMWSRVVAALRDTAGGQGAHLQDEDPVTRALSLLAGLLSQGAVFLEEASGEEAHAPPEDVAHLYGWQAKTWRTEHGEGVELRTRPGARLIGYYARTGGDEWGYFLPDALHGELQRAAQAQGGAVLPDASTLYGNMKDRFHAQGFMRCEVEKGGEGRPGRVRPHYKATARGQRGRFVALRLPIDPEAYNLGTLGTDGEERTSSTVSRSVPSFNTFIDCLGTMGTLPLIRGASFASPDFPHTLTLEDLADIEEGADLPGVVTL